MGFFEIKLIVCVELSYCKIVKSSPFYLGLTSTDDSDKQRRLLTAKDKLYWALLNIPESTTYTYSNDELFELVIVNIICSELMHISSKAVPYKVELPVLSM